MIKLIDSLILYRPAKDDLLARLGRASAGDEAGLFKCMGEMTALCEEHGFSGNLWHCYLTWYLVYHENVYSRACEIRGAVEGTVNNAAAHDLGIFRELFSQDKDLFRDTACEHLWLSLLDYRNVSALTNTFNSRIRDRICDLARTLAACPDTDSFAAAVNEFYRSFGVGKFGLHKAFRIRNENGEVKIEPITNIAHVYLEDLVGYESAKKKLTDNTEAFLEGRSANNCLLYGDAGTGKSSSIKGILNRYYDRGLRVIEVYKHQLRDLNDVVAQIKNRNYRFIIYMDDLSFEDFETEYKYLKALIEGGLEKKPSNILIYATSNRRHLIREYYSDKEEIREDMHASDTVQEKLSLAHRFGVTIYFGSPDKKEYNHIVEVLAQRCGVVMDRDELILEANKWELQHGGLSGRTAQQFIDYVSGTLMAPRMAEGE